MIKSKMEGMKSRIRVGLIIGLTALITITGLYGLLKPIKNGCVMTYMYPTYIPISSPKNLSSSNKYGLYLYHEGWKKIDFNSHLKQLNGVPVLFIPGNGGSYKQVRSVAKESYWAYTNGPLEQSYYQEASLSSEEEWAGVDESKFALPSQYASKLNWFAVDLEGEHSAMDGRILEEHADYVVYAIHRILDQYKDSYTARAKEGVAISGKPPTSVILVGHSMGGFVARAATVHPNLRESAIKTIVTLSSPHQSPPIALQPSLGSYYGYINKKWREGYQIGVHASKNHVSHPMLSQVVVISISGGVNDYQVRSNLETLDGIVPPTHGFMITTVEMRNVWLSMEHQAILWCNQVIVQVSHTLLSLVDSETGHPFSDRQRRLVVFTKMLHSGFQLGTNVLGQATLQPSHLPAGDDISYSAVSQAHPLSACPKKAQWSLDSLEKDLYIQTTTVTILAMDGRRRWLDIDKLGFNGKSHFVLVTNLSPCYGVRIHLWPEKGNSTSTVPLNEKVVEVTRKLTQIPSGPAPKQIEPGSQTEQPAPSAVLWLNPEGMKGFKFITISVAPRPTVSGRPPPAASMAVGQFVNLEEGVSILSPPAIILSTFWQKDLSFKEDHPIALNLAFTISLGLLPVTLSLKTTGCGIKNFVQDQEDGDPENSKLCKLRCFPAVAIAWDRTSGLHVYPNLNSETLVVDSAPALWNSAKGSEKTTVLLLADPHCGYKINFSVSFSEAASRFLLLHNSMIAGLSIAVIFFALMRQAHACEVDKPIPSVLAAIEYNLRLPFPFLLITGVPLIFLPLLSPLWYHPVPSASNFISVSLICYAVVNGFVVILVLSSQLVLYIAAVTSVYFKKRWQVYEMNSSLVFLQWFVNLTCRIFAFKVMRIVRSNPLLVTALVAVIMVCFVHPALGLSVLLMSHVLCCHTALCSYLTTSLRGQTHRKDSLNSKDKGNDAVEHYVYQHEGQLKLNSPLEDTADSSPKSGSSFSDIQLEIFHHRHGMLILHFLAMLMFVPSLVAWFQIFGASQSFPSFLDSILCIGVILHGIANQKPEPLPSVNGHEVRLSFVYMLAGLFSFLSGLTSAPYRVFYAMAAIGALSFVFREIQRRNREKGDGIYVTRKQKRSHRH